MVDEHKCLRKGGRRKLLANPFAEGQELNRNFSSRAKQFGAFDALRGFEKIIDKIKREVDK